MRPPTRPQSHFRYPLSRILASEGAVRIVRELARHGGERSVPDIASATQLSREAARLLLRDDLTAADVVEWVGTGRSVLYRLRADYPLRAVLDQLFAAEEARVRRVFDALAGAARAVCPDALALWVYGSVARGDDAPGSDLDVVLVLSTNDVDAALELFRAALSPVLDREKVGLSAVALSVADVRRLAAARDAWWTNVSADALSVLGPPPDVLAQRLAAPSADRPGAA